VVNLSADGAVRSLGARLFGDLDSPGPASIGAADAVRFALVEVYPGTVFTNKPLGAEVGPQHKVAFDVVDVGFPPRARLVLFPEVQGARLAWEVEVAERTLFTSYRVLIDANDGTLLVRENMTQYAEARHIDGHSPVPASEEYLPANHVLAEIPAGTPESPVGWIDGDGTLLEGNNATTHLGYWWEPGLGDSLGSYDYSFNTPASALVNMWWWVNDLHDRFYSLGFDEAAGNLQQDNFGSGGTGGDPAKVVLYVAGPRNEQFSTVSADGGVSTLNLGWHDCLFCGDHDGLTHVDQTPGERGAAYERGLIAHEYTHAVTNRLAGGPATVGCANGTQAGALNEGTSDFFKASLSQGHPRLGQYPTEGTGVGRSVRNDLTYADFCDVGNSGCEIHDDGMIWSGTLWDLRESMRALEPVSGLASFHQLILEGWASVKCDPTFLDLQYAILDRDNELFGGEHQALLWNVFASRGMGENASTTSNSDTAPVADFSVPTEFACTVPMTPADLTASPSGDNAVRLDYVAPGAGAVEVWREELENPLDRPERIALTDDMASFVDDTVQGGRSYRYHVVAMGPGGLACRSTPSATADATATGACDTYPIFDADVQVNDGNPSCQVTLSWSPAVPGCAGRPIVYNVYRAPTPGFEPSDRLLVGRTTSTSFQDVPPLASEFPLDLEIGNTSYYLVLAQHGTLDDPPDNGLPVPEQLLRWVPAVPTLERETVAFWDFDTWSQGWTTDNTADPEGGWGLVDPSPTWFAGALLAPDEPAGGSGMSWVTGDGGNVTDHDCDKISSLTSPVWDGSDGATILSFDHWTWVVDFSAGINLTIDNGTDRAVVAVTGLNTTQPFDTAGRHSWQRAELNLADFVAPTSTMSMTFSGICGPKALSELGIDNVRVERATSCSRSALQLDQVTVSDTPAGWGNGNGVLEPGETARLEVQLSNPGTSTAFSPLGLVSSGDPRVLVHEPADVFPDVGPTTTAVSAGEGFTVTVSGASDCGSTVVFDFEFVDAAGTISHATWNSQLGSTVSDTVFEDDFETDQGWTPEGTDGRGRWVRGDPVGTLDGTNLANPEDDSPFDAGGQCYVTENTLPGGDANAADVDAGGATNRLRSPLFDLTGYRRARVSFDLWFYDNSTSNPPQDYAEFRTVVVQGGAGYSHLTSFRVDDPTGGWTPTTTDLTRVLPMTRDVRINFFGFDTQADNVVEVGVDNFYLEGDRQQCDPLGVVNPPNGIGDTLRVDRTGSDTLISWNSSPTDASHDGAAYYRLHVAPTPDTGFSVTDTTTSTSTARSLDSTTEYYLITAVNSAGGSDDEP
jgi:hypothetical protein